MAMANNTIVLVGGIHLNHKPTCGETMKNQLFLKRFNELFAKVIPVDTFNWRRRPWCLVYLLFIVLSHPKSKLIISASCASSILIHFLYRFPICKYAFFWVVGGNLAESVKSGRYRIDALNNLKAVIVQGVSMVNELERLGVRNVVFVPNSKPITFIPKLLEKSKPYRYGFVFLSRIHPDKGIKEIIEASDILVANGYADKFYIDFYGIIDVDAFLYSFKDTVSLHKCLNYKGYLDLLADDGYHTLSMYDAMLFPTYWEGEGFPGVILDANIAGLPVIATDWNLNTEVIKEGHNGWIIPPHDSESLAQTMKMIIDGEVPLLPLKEFCVQYVQQFEYRKVLSEELMYNLGLYN